MTHDLRALAELAGVISDYIDQRDIRHETSDETRRALLGAMGFDVSSDAAVSAALQGERARRADRAVPEYLVAEPGAAPVLQLPAGAHWRLECEDGEEFQGFARESLSLPALRLGIHRLWVAGSLCTLLVAPPKLPWPARGWGITLPLYGLRAPQEGGIGDYEDLRSALAGLAGVGAGFVGINPIHAGFPTDPAIISPYMPSHRRRLSTAHIHVPSLPAARRGALIDYPAELAAKAAALESEYQTAGEDDAFSAFLTREGPALERFATYAALAEVHG
ncbi:MAG: 4-alpha-glucanotransferase, partial [Alphaproteobacteria bacterium]|nr:4-alpha-glucanotransferase [Alphaproteobacteria bacterium]